MFSDVKLFKDISDFNNNILKYYSFLIPTINVKNQKNKKNYWFIFIIINTCYIHNLYLYQISYWIFKQSLNFKRILESGIIKIKSRVRKVNKSFTTTWHYDIKRYCVTYTASKQKVLNC